jgi:hypothetical protein
MPDAALIVAPRMGFPALSVIDPRMTASEAANEVVTNVIARNAHNIWVVAFFIASLLADAPNITAEF